MIRWLVIAALLAIACRWLFGKWPWEYLSTSSTRTKELARARRLLGVKSDADARTIREAHRRLASELGEGSTYHGANHPGMASLVARITRSTMARR